MYSLNGSRSLINSLYQKVFNYWKMNEGKEEIYTHIIEKHQAVKNCIMEHSLTEHIKELEKIENDKENCEDWL